MSATTIHRFDPTLHREGIIRLWQSVLGYQSAHNEPNLVIDQKLALNDGLFFAATCEGQVIGSIMAGYDGHRGWLYSLAVAPEHRHRRLGTELVLTAEKALIQRGCLKINLQIQEGNESVQAFYASLGYEVEVRVSMGKRIPPAASRHRALADIGGLIEVTPADEIWIKTSDQSTTYLNDLTPFILQVTQWLQDGQLFYGLCGPVVSGPERYQGLLCSLIVRIDGCDWRQESRSAANFKVGPKPAHRNHSFALGHPGGTLIDGYPVIGRYGSIKRLNRG